MKAVLFDMDGVLVMSEPLIMAAARDALAEGGIKAEYEDFRPYLGAGEEKFIIGLCEREGKTELIEKLTERMFELYEATVGNLEVYPSAKAVIAALKANGHRLALVSSAAMRKLKVSLQAAGIAPESFEIILSGDDVTEKKPSPQPYLLAAERLSEQSGNCIVIEDAVNGVRSAKAAGMQCAAVTTSFSGAELKATGADFVIDELSELIDIID